jgi:AraC-like DNA-binding protein
MGQFTTLRTQRVKGFEELDEIVLGTRREVVQLERGKLDGEVSHASIGDLPIDMASFSLGVRTRGGSHKERVGISILTESGNRAVRSSFESHPGDVLVLQPGCEHENRYYGHASIVVLMVSPTDIQSSFGTEGRMSDPSSWSRNHYHGNAETVASAVPRLQSLLGRLGEVSLTAEAAEYWKRSVIEAVTANVAAGMPSEREGSLPSALKVVRRAEEYLDARAMEPVHISQICSQLHISRRTLHRAFHEALGIGPIAFLRNRRLCAVHTALRAPKHIGTISDIAMQYGFQNLGRFAGYYYQLFGEHPSDTRRRFAGGHV